MDKSLDDLIKENPRKFNLKKGKPLRRDNNTGKNAGPKKGAGVKKNNSPLLTVSKNSGRVTKKTGNLAGKNGPKGTRSINSNINKPGSGKVIVDARQKLLAKNRQKITDARDRLAAITKASKTDLRQKLSAKKEDPARKFLGLKRTVPNSIHKIVREIGSKSSTSRTIIGRTVENELARLPGRTITTPYVPPAYGLPPPPHYYPYQTEPNYDFIRSTAAMDAEPPIPASKRIRSTDKRLGPREEPKPKSEQGHKVFVSNLHHKVTQEDITELFGDVGPLVRATLQRPGIAEVMYVRRDDALRAVDVYHNRQLDGLPMHCTFGNSYESRREPIPPAPKARPNGGGGKASVAPDIGTIHKALFNKSSNSSQIFTVTLPKKDS